ncbi:expressed unknown protein [Ectocarpus siliculosus]|uniref:Uncharacterized protein n=1 Tax=Ectocarpus siliculosus TaxID=2880 RepID=D7FQM7_ECTSI|nr:expressed unknown protein [Ectocarpus siliculosus]|eukprot:CBJ30622.1 expressed unknown protein [Ectocarpus siliculosus]
MLVEVLGLLTLASIFVAAGLLACAVLPCLYCCFRKSRQAHLVTRLENGPHRHCAGGLLMVLVSWAALACCSSAIAGLEKADSGMLVIEDRTEAIAKDVLEIIGLPADTAVGLGLVSDSYDVLEASVGDCENPDIAQAIVAGLDFGSLASEVQTAIDEIDRTSLADIAKQVQDISDAMYTTKVLRRTIVWPTIILALVFVALFILISCTTYEAVACARPSCRAPCTGGFAPFVVFLAVVVYLCAASVISLSGEIPLYVLTIALSYLIATPVRRAVAWLVERLLLSLQCLQRSLLQAPRGLAWRLLDTGWLPVHSATGPIAHTDSLVKYRH